MKKNKMLWVSCLLVGTPYRLLSDSSYLSKRKIMVFATGMTLVILLNAFSGTLFCIQVLELGLSWSMFGGFMIGILSLLLERFIIHSEKSFFTILFRSVLSILIACFFSISADISLFNYDVQKQINESRNNELKPFEAYIDSIYKPKKLLLERNISNLSKRFYSEDSIAKYELGHKNRPGNGKIYKEERKLADSTKAELKRELLVQNKLNDSIRVEKKIMAQNYLDAKNGPLERVVALHEIIQKDYWAELFYWIFFLIFILFDLTVLISKSSSKNTAFDEDILSKDNYQKKESLWLN